MFCLTLQQMEWLGFFPHLLCRKWESNSHCLSCTSWRDIFCRTLYRTELPQQHTTYFRIDSFPEPIVYFLLHNLLMDTRPLASGVSNLVLQLEVWTEEHLVLNYWRGKRPFFNCSWIWAHVLGNSPLSKCSTTWATAFNWFWGRVFVIWTPHFLTLSPSLMKKTKDLEDSNLDRQKMNGVKLTRFFFIEWRRKRVFCQFISTDFWGSFDDSALFRASSSQRNQWTVERPSNCQRLIFARSCGLCYKHSQVFDCCLLSS